MIRLQIRRTSGWAWFTVAVAEEGTVLDALEAAGRQDPSLLFRHACHHASCGSCGLRVNGREQLACLTPIRDTVRRDGSLRLEPMRNFPLVGDLVVDYSAFMERLAAIDLPAVRNAEPLEEELQPTESRPGRFENCIECGLCVSACPVAGSDQTYWGPAALAAVHRVSEEPRGRDARRLVELIDGEHGIWRCHGVMECSVVCPAGVDPAGHIMALRRAQLGGVR